MTYALWASIYEVPAASYKIYDLWATSYELLATSYEIQDMSYMYERRDTKSKIASAKDDANIVDPLDLSMTVWPIDRTKLIIRHLHRLMIVRCKCHIVLSSASPVAISKVKLQWRHLQIKWYRRINFSVIVVETLKLFSTSLVMVSLENKIKIKRSRYISTVHLSPFLTPLM